MSQKPALCYYPHSPGPAEVRSPRTMAGWSVTKTLLLYHPHTPSITWTVQHAHYPSFVINPNPCPSIHSLTPSCCVKTRLKSLLVPVLPKYLYMPGQTGVTKWVQGHSSVSHQPLHDRVILPVPLGAGFKQNVCHPPLPKESSKSCSCHTNICNLA